MVRLMVKLILEVLRGIGKSERHSYSNIYTLDVFGR